MKYQLQERPDRHCLIIRLGREVHKGKLYCDIEQDEMFLQEDNRSRSVEKLAGSIARVKGLTSLTICRKEIELNKIKVADWDIIIPEVLRLIRFNLALKLEEGPRISLDSEQKKERRRLDRTVVRKISEKTEAE